MMYEQTLAERIYAIMKDQVSPSGAGRLRKVTLRCDSMESLDVQRLNSFWQAVARDPVYQSSYIEVHHDPPFGRCTLCNQEFELNEETARCPYCHHEQFRVVHEPPTIETYEME
jgi:Zn finger protein HypA/HybF involved in hydrogenase expression